MARIVMKFGGTSVADLDRIRNVAARVKREVDAGHEVAVVVSAMAGVTNQLVKWCQDLSPLHDAREYDTVVATGEQVTIGLTAIALQAVGVDARSWQGWQVPIVTDGAHGKARVERIEGAELIRRMRMGQVPVVAGFQGIGPDNRVTTLGRGGSDLSAVALAAAVKADRCDIFTDVDGIYTTDPRIVPEARRIPVISFEEMAEMSWRGAKVMHPRAVELGALHGVEIHVRSSFDEGPGTVITGGERLERLETRETVAGIVHDYDVARITLNAIRTGPGTLSKVFTPLAERGISVDVVVESGAQGGAADIAFTVKKGDFEETMRLTREVAEELGGAAEGEQDLGKVSVVGTGMLNRPGYAARMFRTLGEAGIPIRLVSTSEIQVTCVIDAGNVEEAVRRLHRSFELEQVAEEVAETSQDGRTDV